MNETISVIVPVKNDEKKIGKCLDAIFHQTLQPFEVIVVDGHSTDTTVEKASQYPVQIIFEDYGNVGGARQTGLEYAKGDYIAFTDSDCIPEKTWLENLRKEFQSDIVGVGGGTRNTGQGLWEESIALALNSFLGSANSVQDRVLPKRQFVVSISGCNSMYRRADLFHIGGYNTTYLMTEDTDINRRLSKIGHILYTPEAIVVHNQERTLKKFCKRMFFFGRVRGYNRFIDVQVIPPFLLIFVILSLLYAPMVFLFFLFMYFLIILAFSGYIINKNRKWQYFFTIPSIFLLEHVFYSAGFWYGILRMKPGTKE